MPVRPPRFSEAWLSSGVSRDKPIYRFALQFLRGAAWNTDPWLIGGTLIRVFEDGINLSSQCIQAERLLHEYRTGTE